MAQQSIKQQRKILYIIGAVVVTIGAIIAWYFLAWKPSTKDYDTAYASVTGALLSSNTFTNTVTKDIGITSINRGSASALGARSALYQESIRTLAASKAVAHDHVVRSVFDQNKQTFIDYGKQIDEFAGSLLIYLNASESCGDTINSVTTETSREEFMSMSQSCRDTIANSPPAPYKEFDTFYQKYRANMKKVVESYTAFFDARDKNDQPAIDAASAVTKEALIHIITQTNAAVVKAPNFTPPTTQLQQVKDVIDSQKSVFFKW